MSESFEERQRQLAEQRSQLDKQQREFDAELHAARISAMKVDELDNLTQSFNFCLQSVELLDDQTPGRYRQGSYDLVQLTDDEQVAVFIALKERASLTLFNTMSEEAQKKARKQLDFDQRLALYREADPADRNYDNYLYWFNKDERKDAAPYMVEEPCAKNLRWSILRGGMLGYFVGALCTCILVSAIPAAAPILIAIAVGTVLTCILIGALVSYFGDSKRRDIERIRNTGEWQQERQREQEFELPTIERQEKPSIIPKNEPAQCEVIQQGQKGSTLLDDEHLGMSSSPLNLSNFSEVDD